MNLFQETENQLTTFNTELIFGLSHFGLNPADWRLIQKSQNVFQIQNKVEPNFTLEGICNKINGRAKWDEIAFVSL